MHNLPVDCTLCSLIVMYELFFRTLRWLVIYHCVTAHLQSSQLAEPLWTDPDLKSGISVRELISAKTNKAQAGNELSNILPNSSQTKVGITRHTTWDILPGQTWLCLCVSECRCARGLCVGVSTYVRVVSVRGVCGHGGRKQGTVCGSVRLVSSRNSRLRCIFKLVVLATAGVSRPYSTE